MRLVSLEELWVCTLFGMSVRASVCNQSVIHSITRKQLWIIFSKTDDIRFHEIIFFDMSENW